MLLKFYNLLIWLSSALLLRKLRRRAKDEPLYLHAVNQRFARYTVAEQAQAQQHAGRWLWVHAVSLGETRAAAILVAALRRACPEMRLLLTHSTATGWQEGQKMLQTGDMQVWLPWDGCSAVQRFVSTFRPRLGLMMETEIWPQLLLSCQKHRVPVALVNARMSSKTLHKTLYFRRLAQKVYGSFCVSYAQSDDDAKGLTVLGANPVLVAGNLKFDVETDADLLQQGRNLRRCWQAGQPGVRPVAMFASSREGEEELLLSALQSLPKEQQHALLKRVQWLIVPRHPQRFAAVERFFIDAGWQVMRRSAFAAVNNNSAESSPHQAGGQTCCTITADSAALSAAPPVLWLGDSMGEMPLYYSMADVALMGGSFAPLGGQNLIEACACACPVLLGPHTFNFAQASAQALAAGAARRCVDMADAIAQVVTLLQTDAAGQTAALQTMQQAAQVFSQTHRGTAAFVVKDLQQRGLL